MMSAERLAEQDAIERVILRRLHENRIEGYTLEMAKEVAALRAQPAEAGAIVERYSRMSPVEVAEAVFAELGDDALMLADKLEDTAAAIRALNVAPREES